MKKRLLALLLIVCFVVAIPCQASAESTTTPSDNNEQEIVVQQKEETELASTSASSNLYMHYPGEEITAKCPSKSDDWCEDSLGYRAYMVVNGKIKYGFVTCGHSFNESTDGYVYAKDKSTKIGKIYDNGYNNYDDKNNRYDFTFVELLSNHWVSDHTKYGGVKLTGITSPEAGMKLYKEGMTTQRTKSVVDDSFYGYKSAYLKGNNFGCAGVFTTDDGSDPDFVNAHDSGGVVYNADSKVLGIVTYEDDDKTVPYYSGITSADVLQTKRSVYVDHGNNAIKLTLSNTTLTWNKINGISDYYIYYRKGTSGSYTKWKAVQSNTFDISSKGSGYEYIVYCSSGNITSVSNSVKYGLKFSKPSGVSATNDTKTNKPLITWNHVEGANKYEVMYCTSSNSTYKSAGKTGENSFIHSNATDGLLYYYKVKVADGSGSDLSSRAYTVCGCNPPDFTVKIDWATGKPKISWKPIAVASKYEIWVCKESYGTFTKLATTAKTTYIHTAAKQGEEFYYQLIAVVGSDVNSKYSEKKKLRCGYAQPTNVTVEIDKETGKPKVKWSAANDASRYFIYYWDSSVDKNDLSDSISLGGANPAVFERLHKNAVPGETYCYMVQSGWDNLSDFETIKRVDFKYEFPAPKITATLDASSKKPVISWNSVPYANEYIIEVSTTGSNGKFTQLTNQSETIYTHSEAQAGQTYYYRVRGHYVDEKNESYSDYSNVSSVSCLHGKPGLSVDNVALIGKPKLKWDAVDDAEYYDVYYSTTNNGTYTLLHNTTATSFVHGAAVADTTYYYYVVANNSVSSDIIENTCKYPQPRLSIADDTSNGKPTLLWNAVAGVTKYEVMYATSPDGEYSTLDTTDATTFVHEQATLGSTYYYKVRVAVGAGSADSNEKSIVCRLAQPTVTLSRNKATGKPIVSWNSVSGADSYSVYCATDKNGTYTEISKQSEITYTHTEAQAGKTYYYKVEAHANENPSATSACSAANSMLCRYAQPTIKVEIDAEGKPLVTWDGVAGASMYRVWCYEKGKGWEKVLDETPSTSYTHLNATIGTTYQYAVKVMDGVGSEISYSVNFKYQYGVPKISVTTNNIGKPVVRWSSVTGATKYELSCSVNNGEWTVVSNDERTSYLHLNARVGSKYRYKVRAFCKTYSDYSTEKLVICKLPKTSVTLSNDKATGKPIVSWKAVKGAHYYFVYYSTSKNGKYTRIATQSGRTYTHKYAQAGKTYYYKVRAYTTLSPLATSDFSSVESIVCK